MIECGVVIPSRNNLRDIVLVERFMQALNESDFPRQYPLQLLVGWDTWDVRADGVDAMVKQNPEFILCADNDMIVPKVWWKEVLSIFQSNPKISAVGPMLDGLCYNYYQDYKMRHWDGQYTEVEDKSCYNLADGFIVFRTKYLLESGVREPGGVSN